MQAPSCIAPAVGDTRGSMRHREGTRKAQALRGIRRVARPTLGTLKRNPDPPGNWTDFTFTRASSVRSAPALHGPGNRFGDRGPLLRMGLLRGNAKHRDQAGWLAAIFRLGGPVVNARRVEPTCGRGHEHPKRSRARVSFIVLQKSKSCVWHRGSASTVKAARACTGA